MFIISKDLGRIKQTYILSDGLGPYFKDKNGKNINEESNMTFLSDLGILKYVQFPHSMFKLLCVHAKGKYPLHSKTNKALFLFDHRLTRLYIKTNLCTQHYGQTNSRYMYLCDKDL